MGGELDGDDAPPALFAQLETRGLADEESTGVRGGDDTDDGAMTPPLSGALTPAVPGTLAEESNERLDTATPRSTPPLAMAAGWSPSYQSLELHGLTGLLRTALLVFVSNPVI